MLVEKYIDNLKSNGEKNKIRHLCKEYNKELEHKLKSSSILQKSTAYTIIGMGIFFGVCGFRIKSEIIPLIKLTYIIPLLISSFLNIIYYKKLVGGKCSDRKLFQRYTINILIEITLMIFFGTYLMQWILFEEWRSINYIKMIGLLIISLLPIIISTRINAPNKFINQFTGEVKKYTYNNEWTGSVVFILIIIANITKPYMLILILSYAIILVLSYFIVYEIYKAQKYDYIQSLLKQSDTLCW